MTQTNNSVASFKDRLSRIAHEVRDAAEEFVIPQSSGGAAAAEDTPTSDRRSSQRSSQSTPPIGSPVANGAESGYPDEIAKYKADIQKLQASEAEIKALSFNYAAILKEKEEQLSKLREENGSLRNCLVVGHESRDESQKTLTNSSNVLKGTADQSPYRPARLTSQVNPRSTGNHTLKGNFSRQDGISNGGVQAIQYDAIQQRMELKTANSQGNGKEHINMHEENHRSLLAVQASLDSEIKNLKAQLNNEQENAATIKLKLQEEQKLNESSQRELHILKTDKERTSIEMQQLQMELNQKISELRQLHVELNRRNMEETNQSLENMKNMIRSLENENAKLKIEKDELETSLKLHTKNTSGNLDADNLDYPNRKSSKSNEAIEEMSLSMRQLEDTLRNTCKEREKALQEVARLKQHLLEKELADSDKMDEDSQTIDELKAYSEHQKAQISQLEKALWQEVAKKEEIKKLKSDEIRRLNEVIDGLNKNLADSMRTVDSKNVELLNLQTALGQYYAEIEAKEHLGGDLAMAREESAILSESLKVANREMEILKREKEDIAAKLSQAEKMLSESKLSIQKLEDDNSKLRRALERSMTTLNRMSLDSDNHVDRRIVIKLLVTYFQRNHSKEVLDLMVRMLGFSEEDKQRIGFAQHAAGKGVVRGVLGLPGRLVGGILGGSSPEAASHVPSENQSFADLWVDFLLKETEERERRESSEAARMSSSAQDRSTNTRASSVLDHRTNLPGGSTAAISANQTSILHAKQNLLFEHPDSEFATVPLTSSVSPSERGSSSRPPPRY